MPSGLLTPGGSVKATTRQQFIERVIEEWAPPQPEPAYSPFYEDEEWSKLSMGHENEWIEKIQRWGANATPEEREMLFDFAFHPIDLSGYSARFQEKWSYDVFDEESWTYHLVMALDGWAESDVIGFLSKAKEALQNTHACPVILASLTHLARAEILPLLQPLIDSPKKLTEEELGWIVNALMLTRSLEARNMLVKLRDTMYQLKPNLQPKMASALAYRTSQFGEPEAPPN